jgi:3-isopropylmalate/(R)-2-methylmalate dehydratase large subunit
MRIRVDGRVPPGTTSKDLVLMIIGRIGAQGARGYVIEFCGAAIEALSVEARFTLCNMAVEAGARGALIAPDAKAVDYVLAHAPDLAGAWRDAALAQWRELRSDVDAVFEVEHRFDAADVEPHVTWGTSPDQVAPITGRVPAPGDLDDAAQRRSAGAGPAYTGLAAGAPLDGTPIQHVFIGSCTNGRIEDLRAAADVSRPPRGAGVRAMVVPAPARCARRPRPRAWPTVFLAAGLEWREPGCSHVPGDERRRAGARRALRLDHQPQLRGPQGRGAITHLVSPAMAAAAAVTGR